MNTRVFKPRRVARLLVSDARNVKRDPTLLFAFILSIVPAFIFGLWHADWDTAAQSAFGISQVSRFLSPIFLVLPAFLLGWISGFLLLEDRDDGPLLALDVTPIGKRGFFAYRIAVTIAITAVVSSLSFWFLAPGLAFPKQLLLLLLTGGEAVIAAFVLLAVARNKVEGLAVTKVTNLLSLGPLLAAIDSPWRYLAAPVPTFWVGEALGLSASPLNDVTLAVLSLLIHAAWAITLYHLALRRVG